MLDLRVHRKGFDLKFAGSRMALLFVKSSNDRLDWTPSSRPTHNTAWTQCGCYVNRGTHAAWLHVK